jgi:predicted MFS family arabinose efflux permease
VTFSTYAALTRNPVVRRILVLGFVLRVPLWAANVAVTLHVVTHLHRSYTEAGVVSMVAAGALAISSPWRGGRLDRIGLRASVAPSLVVNAAAWAVAPFVGYWPMLVLVALADLFAVPSFSIIRSVLIAAVSEEERTTALSIDSVATEVSFMVGPVLGVLGATYLPTPVALVLCQVLAVGAGLVLWIVNPPLQSHTEAAAEAAARPPLRTWLSPRVLMILLVSLAATVILTSEDLGSVAAMRALHHTSSLGWVLALWGLGSAIGGTVYGAMSRHPHASTLLALLGATTALVAFAHSELWFVVLLFVSGFFCAPTITATVDDLSRAVPAVVRNEAMGWHGSAPTLGSALGAPLVGRAIDSGGWSHGFLYGGLAGLVIALAAVLVIARRRAASVAADLAADLGSAVGPDDTTATPL